jgi:hypothetical protein
MKDADGNTLVRGSVVGNPDFGPEQVTAQVVGYDYRNGNILIRKDFAGELAISLNREQLLSSRWRLMGFKELPDLVIDL